MHKNKKNGKKKSISSPKTGTGSDEKSYEDSQSRLQKKSTEKVENMRKTGMEESVIK